MITKFGDKVFRILFVIVFVLGMMGVPGTGAKAQSDLATLSEPAIQSSFSKASSVDDGSVYQADSSPEGWVANPANGHYYRLTDNATWQSAEVQAVNWGGHLVTVNDQVENDWLVSTFGDAETFWIGYTDQYEEGNWIWINGENPGYTNWLQHLCGDWEPNDVDPGEDYAAFNYNGVGGGCGDIPPETPEIGPGKWNDISETATLRGITELNTTPAARIFVEPNEDNVFASDWPIGTLITLEIDDPATPQTPDYTTSQVYVEYNDWDHGFRLGGIFDIQPGYVVMVSGGNISRQLAVTHLAVTNIDIEADTVSGTGYPGSEIHVGTICDENSCASRNIFVNGDGNWLADFSIPGDASHQNSGVFDLRAGFGSSAYEMDDDGDSTKVNWYIPNVPDPRFHVQLTQNNVEGYGWPLGASVTITIDTDNNGIPEFTSSPQPVLQADWDPNSTVVRFDNVGGIDLAAGMVVSMTDGTTLKTHVVTILTLTSVDPVTDTVTGTAAPNSYLEVGHLCDQNGCAIRRITADALGNWLADFAVPGAGTDPDEQRLFDIKPGTGSEVRQPDEDGDHTDIDWNVPNPRFDAWYRDGYISAYDWPLGTLLTLDIEDAGTPQSPDFSTTTVVGIAEWDPNQTQGEFRLNGAFEIQPGMTLTVSGASSIKELVVSNLTITSVDQDTDIITGGTEPNQQMWMHYDRSSGDCCREFQADDNGVWIVNYSQPGPNGEQVEDILPGSSGTINARDNDEDNTSLSWRVPNPNIGARISDNDQIEANEWPLGAISLQIDDPLTPQEIDYSEEGIVEVADWDSTQTYVEFRLQGLYDLKPGDIVTLTSGSITRQHTVIALSITDIDVDTDVISGTGAANSTVEIYSGCDQSHCSTRTETADGTGHWFTDFSDGSQGQPTVNILPGMWVDAHQWDENGNSTYFGINLPNPSFGARPADNSIEGWQWPLGAIVTIEIDDPATTQTIDYTGQTDVYIPQWNPNETRFDLYFNGEYDLKPGDTVRVTDGVTTKTHLVTDLAFDEINPGTDIVSGHANPNTQVNVWACGNDFCVNREEMSNQAGSWQSNFSIPGELDWEQDTIDIQAGTWVDSSQNDDDGDGTYFGRNAGSTITGTAYLIDIAPENTVAGVMIEACNLDNFCRTGLTDESGNYWISGLPAGTYTLRAIPPGTNLPGSLGPIDISYDEILFDQDITVPAPPLPPPPDAIEPAHTGGGTIVVYWMDDLTLTTNGCTNGTASFELSVLEDGYIVNGEMTETPTGSGTYKATIPSLYPHHGVTEIVYTVNCPDGNTVETPFFIYIDPSGVVKDTAGMPIPDATVTLLYADNPDGPFSEVPDGSTMMSPSNRTNPDATNANGEFGWDVVAGFYRVRVEKAGCFSPTDPTQSFVESAVLTIPPPVTDLELILECSLPPSASAGGPYSINEGDAVTLDASASSDPEAGALTFAWDIDNDGQYDDANGVTTITNFMDDGSFTVGLRVTDPSGLSATDTAEINVANVSPTATIQQASVNDLGVLSGNGIFTDPGADTWTASVNFGDEAGVQSLALNPDNSFSLNHVYSTGGVYTVEVCISDDDAGKGCDQIQVTVASNQPPVAEADGPYLAFEGTTVKLNASKSTDPDHNIIRYDWDLDNDGQFDDATGIKPKVTFTDNGLFTVRVRVTDSGGLDSIDASTVTVKNLPPVVTSLSLSSLVRVGAQVNGRATFKDAGLNDTFTATWKWGDGTSTSGVINGYTATGSHAYTKPGIYIVMITIKDKDGGTTSVPGLVIILPKR